MGRSSTYKINKREQELFKKREKQKERSQKIKDNFRKALEIIKPGWVEKQYGISIVTFRKFIDALKNRKDDFIKAGEDCGLSRDKACEINSDFIIGGKQLILETARLTVQNKYLSKLRDKKNNAKAKTILRKLVRLAGKQTDTLLPEEFTEAEIKRIRKEIHDPKKKGGPRSEPKKTKQHDRGLSALIGEQSSSESGTIWYEKASAGLSDIYFPIHYFWYGTPGEHLIEAAQEGVKRQVEQEVKNYVLEMLDSNFVIIPRGSISALIKQFTEKILKAWDHSAEKKPRK